MSYLEEFIILGQRKGTQAQILSFSHSVGNWHVSLETTIDGAELKISNVQFKDLEGAIGEVVTKYKGFAPQEMRAPQIEHRPATVDSDEIPF